MDAYKYLLKLLTIKDYSEFKLREKCLQKNITEQDFFEAIEKLKERKLFREDFYTDARIRGLARKLYGPHYIERKLAEERVSVDLDHIQRTMDEANLDFDQLAQAYYQKNSEQDPSRLKQKLYARGFSAESIEQLEIF